MQQYETFWAKAKVPLPRKLPGVLPHMPPITDSTTSFTTWDGVPAALAVRLDGGNPQ